MSALSRVELELVHDDLSIDTVHALLVKSSWVAENDHQCIISEGCIEFSEAFQGSYFKLELYNEYLIIESDSPWELELLAKDLQEVTAKRTIQNEMLNK